MVHLTGCPVQRLRAAGQRATVLPLLSCPRMESRVMDTGVEPNGCFRPSTSYLPLSQGSSHQRLTHGVSLQAWSCPFPEKSKTGLHIRPFLSTPGSSRIIKTCHPSPTVPSGRPPAQQRSLSTAGLGVTHLFGTCTWSQGLQSVWGSLLQRIPM